MALGRIWAVSLMASVYPILPSERPVGSLAGVCSTSVPMGSVSFRNSLGLR